MMRLFFSLLITIAPLALTAHEFAKKNITVDHPWSKPTPPISEYGVAYFNVSNSGQADDILLEIKISGDIARSASIHDVIHDGEIMRMREVTNGKRIPAGGKIKFCRFSVNSLENLGKKSGAEASCFILQFEIGIKLK